MSFGRLAEVFESNKFVLPHISKWEDPYENWITSAILCEDGKKVSKISPFQIYGSCWTKKSVSDAMWRIYSPDKSGVRIKTTPTLLANSIINSSQNISDLTIYVGKVIYEYQRIIDSKAENLAINIANRNSELAIANTLLLKRRAFSHEDEIRFLILDPNKNSRAKFLRLNLNPLDIIQTILIDSRAKNIEVDKYIEVLKNIYKYKRRLSQSSLYNKPNTIRLHIE